MTITPKHALEDPALQHLPPRKRLAAAMMAKKVASWAPAGKRPHLDASTSAAWRSEDVASRPAWARPWPSNKPRPMIPESDVIREARARAAMAAGEPAVSVAAAKAEASARAKGERAAAARQVAIAKAEAANAAAKEAKELARLAEEAKHKAEDLERERAKRREGGSAKTKSKAKTTNPDAERAEEPASLTDDELARRLHSEMNASPRFGRSGRRGALATEEKANEDEDSNRAREKVAGRPGSVAPSA